MDQYLQITVGPSEHDAVVALDNVSMSDWRARARRMPRRGLGKLLLPDSSLPELSAGAHGISKGERKDLFVGDRRLRNAIERYGASSLA